MYTFNIALCVRQLWRFWWEKDSESPWLGAWLNPLFLMDVWSFEWFLPMFLNEIRYGLIYNLGRQIAWKAPSTSEYNELFNISRQDSVSIGLVNLKGAI